MTGKTDDLPPRGQVNKSEVSKGCRWGARIKAAVLSKMDPLQTGPRQYSGLHRSEGQHHNLNRTCAMAEVIEQLTQAAAVFIDQGSRRSLAGAVRGPGRGAGMQNPVHLTPTRQQQQCQHQGQGPVLIVLTKG